MSEKFEVIEGAIPEGGVAHMVANFGKVVVTADLQDAVIELLPEEVRGLYFTEKKK